MPNKPILPAVGRDITALSELAAQTAIDKMGEKTLIIDVADMLVVTDFFVITSGSSTRHVRTLVEAVEEKLKAVMNLRPSNMEGHDTFQWVLLDYGSFVVHVFEEERRSFYNLEKLWSDCPTVVWSNDD